MLKPLYLVEDTESLPPIAIKKNIFQFKQFAVDQANCAMKVNTDGVLLGVMAKAESPQNVLDIGTGTGVIALILAQRFTSAKITAVEIDESAALTAANNFSNSVFNSRLQLSHSSFEHYFQRNSRSKFDLIVSNPPFFIDSLRSDNALKGIARHTNQFFFKKLLGDSARHLDKNGHLVLIVPVTISALIEKLGLLSGLRLHKKISIRSFSVSIPHREVLFLGFTPQQTEPENFVIYARPKEYSTEYQALLKDFFTIF